VEVEVPFRQETTVALEALVVVVREAMEVLKTLWLELPTQAAAAVEVELVLQPLQAQELMEVLELLSLVMTPTQQ
jgi:hypothetical protein